MVTFAFSSETRHILVSGPRSERASGQSKYIMEKENGEIACEASSEHVFLNREGRFVRMKREMPEFCEAIEKTIPKEEQPHE